MRRLLAFAFATMASRVVQLRLRAALRFGDIETALLAVPVGELQRIRPVIEEILRRTANAGARIGLEGDLIVRLGRGALPTGELAYWARTRAAGLVVGITDQSRRALRQTIVQAIQSGLTPLQASRLVEAVVGLNTVQARALLRREADLIERGVTLATRERILARYADQLRRQRARVIARHELIQAANAGRRAVWRRDVSSGLIAPDRWEREWVAIVPNDGRTCPICEGLDGARAPIGGVYPDGSDGPPAHVLCRCTEVLRRAA